MIIFSFFVVPKKQLTILMFADKKMLTVKLFPGTDATLLFL
jgi:hypothetical protein